MSAQTPEGRVKSKLLARFQKLKDAGDMIYWQSQAGNQFGVAGLDLTICYFGCFISLEVKRYDKKGKTSTRQKLALQDVKDAGGVSRLIDSELAEDELFSFVLPMLKIQYRNLK